MQSTLYLMEISGALCTVSLRHSTLSCVGEYLNMHYTFESIYVLLEIQEQLLESSADIISLPKCADDQIEGKYEFNGSLLSKLDSTSAVWISSFCVWRTGKKDTQE